MFQVTGLAHAYAKSRTGLFIIFALLTLLLSACSGTTATKEGSCVDTADNGVFCLKIVDTAGAITRNVDRNSDVTVTAFVKNSDDSGREGLVVTFTSEIGVFGNEGTALTDSSGSATITLTSGSESKAGSATASVSVDGEELTVSYGFTVGGTQDTGTADPDPDPTPDPTPDPDAGAVSTSVTGAIEFVSASPQTIALRNTGGAGLSEFSTIQFRLIGSDGLPMVNKLVNFSLNTTIGGVDLDPASASTNSEGIVSTTVQSGSVSTAIRVTASTQVTDTSGATQTVFTQSDQLVVSTGIPDQDSFTISLSTTNVEAWDYNGVEVEVIARLADHFNNVVPDGTAVYFTAEGGAIEPSCFTTNGGCTVNWISQNPRPLDHRASILATTIGTESFHDTNSDGKYSLADGEPYADSNNNGVYDEPFVDAGGTTGQFDEPFGIRPNGNYDLGEVFTDALNGLYDEGFVHFSGAIIAAETYIDLGNGQYDIGETLTVDVDGDGVYDIAESLTTDVNGNGSWDVGDSFDDTNNDGVWDSGDSYADAGNGKWDEDEPFTDALNGVWDQGESYTDADDSNYDLGDFFIDYNGNGKYDGAGNNPAGDTAFTDSNNGNTFYDGSGLIAAGETFTNATSNLDGTGLELTLFDGPGFADLAEPYLDANENEKRDIDEVFVDTNNDGLFTATGDGKYTGILCIEDNNCSAQNTLHIQKTGVIIMSSSSALVSLTNSEGNIIYYENDPRFAESTGNIDISNGDSISLLLQVTDTAGQVMPEGTTISVDGGGAKITGSTSFKVANGTGSGYAGRGTTTSELARERGHFLSFTLTDADINKSEGSAISITITTPKGNETIVSVSFDT